MVTTTRRDAVAMFSGLNLTHAEVEDALDAVLGLGRYVGAGDAAARAAGWDGRWESLDDEEINLAVSRALWAHATNGQPYPY